MQGLGDGIETKYQCKVIVFLSENQLIHHLLEDVYVKLRYLETNV